MSKKAKKEKRKSTSLDQAHHFPEPPAEVMLLAAKELSKGKNVDQICETVQAALVKDPALIDKATLNASILPEPAAPPVEDVLWRRYLQAYLRLATGQINGLPTEDMDDIAQLCQVPANSFNAWRKRRGLDNA